MPSIHPDTQAAAIRLSQDAADGLLTPSDVAEFIFYVWCASDAEQALYVAFNALGALNMPSTVVGSHVSRDHRRASACAMTFAGLDAAPVL